MFKKFLIKVVALMSAKYVHIKTGNIYMRLFTANKFSGKPDFPKMVVYMSDTGVIYTRPLEVFDEKFKSVSLFSTSDKDAHVLDYYAKDWLKELPEWDFSNKKNKNTPKFTGFGDYYG